MTSFTATHHAPGTDEALTSLLEHAAQRKHAGMNYAGEVTCGEAYDFLRLHGGALVDVRTLPEWQFVGMPDLSGARGRLIAISWKTYPAFAANGAFADKLAAEAGVDSHTPLFFICRSGGRSLDAALAMTSSGWRNCFNVIGGFEGEPDAEGHRGSQDGWKAKKYPWKQG